MTSILEGMLAAERRRKRQNLLNWLWVALVIVLTIVL